MAGAITLREMANSMFFLYILVQELLYMYEFWWYFRRGAPPDPGLTRWSPTFAVDREGFGWT